MLVMALVALACSQLRGDLTGPDVGTRRKRRNGQRACYAHGTRYGGVDGGAQPVERRQRIAAGSARCIHWERRSGFTGAGNNRFRVPPPTIRVASCARPVDGALIRLLRTR